MRAQCASRLRTPVGARRIVRGGRIVRRTSDTAGRPDVHKADPYAEDSAQRLITGSPKTALEKLQELLHVNSANYLLCIFSFGDLAPEHAMRSLELFTSEVKPELDNP